MTPRLHIFQHVPFEEAGSIADWASSRGLETDITRLYLNEPFPGFDDFDFLVIMGGPMGVEDFAQHSWLRDELEFIRTVFDRINRNTNRKKIFGVCLGAQLLAKALGGEVFRNPVKEIGFFPVSLSDDGWMSDLFPVGLESFDVFHWHGDTFSIPENGQRLAFSENCANQAFLIEDRALGFQFHLEMEQQNIETILASCGAEIVDALELPEEQREAVMSNEEILSFVRDRGEILKDSKKILFPVLDSFFLGISSGENGNDEQVI